MAWETRRGKGRYYTRSARAGGRVIREYIGGGIAAEQAAVEDHARREERERRKGELAEFDRAGERLSRLGLEVDRLAAIALYAAGYHRHKGEWRCQRERDGDGSERQHAGDRDGPRECLDRAGREEQEAL